MHRFKFQDPHMAIDGQECLLELLDAGCGLSQQAIQLTRKAGLLAWQEPPGPEGRKLTTQVCVGRINLSEDCGRVALKPENFYFPVHSLGNREDGFVDGLSRNREFFLQAPEKFQEHRGLRIQCPIREIM